MLMVGLTGGIGAGKSAVAKRLVRRGAVLVDSDTLAREVVAVGSEGLAEVADAFGPGVLGPDGGLDRQALAALVFGDEVARRRLEGIIHPRVRARSAELVAAAAPDAVVVNDVPLLVEVGLAPTFHLVVVVEADEDVRVGRLRRARGMTAEQARARIAAQAPDAARRVAADVLLRNNADLARLDTAVDSLWHHRLRPYEDNLRHGRCVAAPPGPVRIVAPDPDRPAQAARLTARIRHAVPSVSGRDATVAHIGSTAVPGLPGTDVIDLMLAARSPAQADTMADALTRAGLPPRSGDRSADTRGVRDERWPEPMHGSADPGRPVHLWIRLAGSPGWRLALLLRDHLRAVPTARDGYATVKRESAATRADAGDYARAKEPWFDAETAAAERWAAETGWQPPAC